MKPSSARPSAATRRYSTSQSISNAVSSTADSWSIVGIKIGWCRTWILANGPKRSCRGWHSRVTGRNRKPGQTDDCDMSSANHVSIQTMTSINPATGQILRRYEADTPDQIEGKLVAAQRAIRSSRREPFAERARKMRRAADVLEARKQEFARTITLEM